VRNNDPRGKSELLIAAAERGETIVITKNGAQGAELATRRLWP
jgi:antitoxin (DNA-binding transcriptional repressor) of toxin-antitoxin stability system